MKVVVVGLGVQGKKRRRLVGSDFVASVDPVKPEADYRSIEDVPLGAYDAALCCIPDLTKHKVLSYLLENGRHVLVEKPLLLERLEQMNELQALANRNGVVCYTAYNHRFEPHFVRMRNLIASQELGRLYSFRMFYGNGTARLVRDSEWRDTGSGVLTDLGSHLLDTVRFWLGDLEDSFRLCAVHRFENRAPDHVVVRSEGLSPHIELEMTLLSWRNHFSAEVLAERGSAHIASLCKWGPATFIRRTRVLPSGRPPEEAVTLVQEDPTWALEYGHFKQLCASGTKTDLSNDIWLGRTLGRLSLEAAGVTGTAGVA